MPSKKKKYNPNKTTKRPTNFGTPLECIKLVKKSVYLIARGRILDPEKSNILTWVTLGTGFLVAPNRMVTAAHVLNNPVRKDELSQHKDGDKYYLIKSDDDGNYHFRFSPLELNKSIFVYPEIDLGVLYIEDEFYQEGDRVYALKDDYIRINQDFCGIGTEIAILGYPLCNLNFIDGDVLKPQAANILLRSDIGVINCRYKKAKDSYLYEFTVAFNPGNSGGPIFNWRTGQLLSIVHGYKAIPINISESILSEDIKKNINISQYKESSYIDVVHANYSVGFATPSFVEILKHHNIIT